MDDQIIVEVIPVWGLGKGEGHAHDSTLRVTGFLSFIIRFTQAVSAGWTIKTLKNTLG